VRYTLDTEFYERGHLHPVELISIGIVGEDGRTFYAVNKDFDWQKVPYDHWLVEHVFPILGDNPNTLKTRRQIKAELTNFFARDLVPQLWAYFADYDFVVFCQIFGTMLDTLPQMPQLCLDIEQMRITLGLSRAVYPNKVEPEHNALNDALWDMACLKTLLVHHKSQLDRIGVGSV
jgi:hypothetical protein